MFFPGECRKDLGWFLLAQCWVMAESEQLGRLFYVIYLC